MISWVAESEMERAQTFNICYIDDYLAIGFSDI